MGRPTTLQWRLGLDPAPRQELLSRRSAPHGRSHSASHPARGHRSGHQRLSPGCIRDRCGVLPPWPGRFFRHGSCSRLSTLSPQVPAPYRPQHSRTPAGATCPGRRTRLYCHWPGLCHRHQAYCSASHPDYVRWAATNVSIPWFAIGGINLANIDDVLAAGARRICVVSASSNAPDIATACRALSGKLARA